MAVMAQMEWLQRVESGHRILEPLPTDSRPCRSFQVVMLDLYSGHSKSVVRWHAKVCDGQWADLRYMTIAASAQSAGPGQFISILTATTGGVPLCRVENIWQPTQCACAAESRPN